MIQPIKSCALCAHCVIDLGGPGYSEYTPGKMGSIECGNGHAQDIKKAWDAEGLIGLAKLGRRCSDFELLEIT